jgi:hypothetical protein
MGTGSTRRTVLLSGCALIIASIALRPIGALAASDGYADQAAMDAWMSRWRNRLGAASGPLHLGRFLDPMYFLLDEIAWSPNPGESVSPVSVPIGFVTDLASIPRIFWSLLRPDGNYAFPAIIHDYLYWFQPEPKEKADLTLLYAMKEFGVGAFERETIYRAVQAGGGSAWTDNRKRRASGEKRILKSFPQDPKISWQQWARMPDVFQ